MALQPYEIDRGYDFDETGSNRFDRGNTNLDKSRDGFSYRWRSVTFVGNNKIAMAGANDVVIGSFLGFNSGKAVVRVQSVGTKYKNGGASAIAINSKIIGDTRIVETGGSAQYGYVKAVPAVPNSFNQAALENIFKGRGTVMNGGVDHAANTDSLADVLVMQTIGS